MLKLKFTWDLALLDITNSCVETVIFDPKEMIGILDLRLMGYYKIEKGILQQNFSKYYRFGSADTICEHFNRFINTLRKERKEEMEEKYLWLDLSDERKYMSDRNILYKYVDLNKSCITDTKKKQVMDILCKYKEAFSLRDKIGTCPNIEVEIDATDKSPFLIRIYHIKEEEKKFIDTEIKRLCYLGILKDGFSAYFNPVMLISRKVTKDKIVVTDFKHFNVRIAKNNLAYPLLRHTFLVLVVLNTTFYQYQI